MARVDPRAVQKRRLSLPIDQAEALCSGELDPEGLDPLDAQVAQEVLVLRHSLDLRPTAITAYRRRAFEGRHENAGLRVTFDTQVGKGTLDFPAILNACDAAGAEWLIVEQDRCERPPLESVGMSLAYLQSLGRA